MPPNFPVASIRVTLSPLSAAKKAAVYPAGPAPIIASCVCCVMISFVCGDSVILVFLKYIDKTLMCQLFA